MAVSLRKKKLSKGRVRLYLDYYPAIKDSVTGKQTRREFLDLFIYEKPTTQLQKEHNKETLLIAENVRSNRELDMFRGTYNLQTAKNKKLDFLKYFMSIADERNSSDGNYGNWLSTYNYLKDFSGGILLVESITEQFCKDFKKYLSNVTYLNNPKKQLSQNTKLSYFNKFKAALKKATKDKIFIDNPCENVEGFEEQESKREFLIEDELIKLLNTDCENIQLKDAALFSVFTGLRWSDVYGLEWNNLVIDKETYFVRYRPDKNKSTFETLPINQQAFELLNKQEKSGKRIFAKLKKKSNADPKLKEWIKKAGIEKYITFHCFRHTNATLLLTKGVDIFTVSKMLAHKHVKTTQIYGKIVDTLKIEAANKLKI